MSQLLIVSPISFEGAFDSIAFRSYMRKFALHSPLLFFQFRLAFYSKRATWASARGLSLSLSVFLPEGRNGNEAEEGDQMQTPL